MRKHTLNIKSWGKSTKRSFKYFIPLKKSYSVSQNNKQNE